MPTFFLDKAQTKSSACRVVAIQDKHAVGIVSTLTFDEVSDAITWENHKSIITRVTSAQGGNFQFLHTMDNDVYIYVFGDRIGQVNIYGLSVASGTKTDGTELDPSGKHGFSKIAEWYADHRVAKRKEPVLVSVGGAPPFRGFVVGYSADAADPVTHLISFCLQLAVMPEK